jgi:hypothetical protein
LRVAPSGRVALRPTSITIQRASGSPKAIINFNDRVLRGSAGRGTPSISTRPDDAFVEEFVHDVRSLLAAEYGEEPAILIKDPRIALLAPLWHRALEAAGNEWLT